MVQTLAFNSRLPVLLGASPFYRIPSSPIAQGLWMDETDFIAARLTAMGVEGAAVSRPEIYTLFITTRIINFLKGLNPVHDLGLNDALNAQWAEPRTRLGIQLLKQLLNENTLYFSVSNGLLANKLFQAGLFFSIVEQANTIGCLNGSVIDVSDIERVRAEVSAA